MGQHNIQMLDIATKALSVYITGPHSSDAAISQMASTIERRVNGMVCSIDRLHGWNNTVAVLENVDTLLIPIDDISATVVMRALPHPTLTTHELNHDPHKRLPMFYDFVIWLDEEGTAITLKMPYRGLVYEITRLPQALSTVLHHIDRWEGR